jgi:hypothetical protein
MAVPTIAADAVLVQSVQMPKESIKIEGYDFNKVLLAQSDSKLSIEQVWTCFE